MRKIIALTAALVMLISVCSCSRAENSGSEGYGVNAPQKTGEGEKTEAEEATGYGAQVTNGESGVSGETGQETSLNEEVLATTSKTDYLQSLEDHTVDYDNMKQVNGEELITVDFTECVIAALDNFAAKIYEYLSEEETKVFIEHIVKAKISPEEYDGETLIYDGGGAFAYRFRITLNTGEFIYIGALDLNNTYMVLINGYHGYPCDEDLFNYILECYQGACNRFSNKALGQ